MIHNSIIVGDYRYYRVFGFSSMHYVSSLEPLSKIDVKLPDQLGDDAEWSPDGQWIVFSVEQPINGSAISQIYIMRADGSQRTHIPLPPGSSWGDWGEYPTWSPDGNQIAFAGPKGIFIADVTCLLQGAPCTPESHLLVEAPNGYWPSGPDWASNDQIIYSAGGNVWEIHSNGQQHPPVDLTLAYADSIHQPRWSPDGTKIVAVCNFNICTMNRDGSNLTFLTKDTTTYRLMYTPHWSPDGQQIAYIATFTNQPVPGYCGPDSGCPLPTSIFFISADGNRTAHLPFEDDVVVKWFYWYP